jgi:hypothetical protein
MEEIAEIAHMPSVKTNNKPASWGVMTTGSAVFPLNATTISEIAIPNT